MIATGRIRTANSELLIIISFHSQFKTHTASFIATFCCAQMHGEKAFFSQKVLGEHFPVVVQAMWEIIWLRKQVSTKQLIFWVINTIFSLQISLVLPGGEDV